MLLLLLGSYLLLHLLLLEVGLGLQELVEVAGRALLPGFHFGGERASLEFASLLLELGLLLPGFGFKLACLNVLLESRNVGFAVL